MAKIPTVEPSKLVVEDVLKDRTMPLYYANGVTMAFSIVDATLIFQRNHDAVVVLMMPFAGLKSLKKALDSTLASIEKGLGESIPDSEIIAKKWAANTIEKIELNKK